MKNGTLWVVELSVGGVGWVSCCSREKGRQRKAVKR